MRAVTSLWPQKVVFKSQIYSARAKLKLISDQTWDALKIVLKAGSSSMCAFQNRSSTSGILNKSTVSAKFTCDDLCRESKNYWEKVIWWYFARIKSGNIVPGWLWIVLSVSRTWLIVWFLEVVDRQISGMSWRSCYKNIVYKHENALWVFSWSDFVLDNRLWGQERWILGMF